MVLSNAGTKVLPLRTINLQTAPLHKRAIAWSSDAELAIAADDSVHVYIPQFPGPQAEPEPHTVRNRRKDKEDEDGGDDEDDDVDELESDSSDEGESVDVDTDDEDSQWGERDYVDSDGEKGATRGKKKKSAQGGSIYQATEIETRHQFTSGSRHIPVSYPPIDPRINRELYENAGLEFPYDSLAAEDDARPLPDPEADYEEQEPHKQDPNHASFTRPSGAGTGLLSSAAGTMNSVVAIDWSPSGVGRNRRPVLGVLTASGVLAIYGEGTSVRLRSRSRYDLSSWEVLWAVGERMIVPPQREFGECVISFAWARGLGHGKALLGYETDQHEAVILSVESDFVADEANGGQEVAYWNVEERGRFKTDGPHPPGDVMDPDCVPCGTSFGLRWGPWLTVGNKKTCVLSYLARNYVGFRRITVPIEWAKDAAPSVAIDEEDLGGMCIFLAADAFAEWEDAIWSIDGKKVCRGIVATPLVVKCFQCNLSGDEERKGGRRHGLDRCWSVVIHPPNLAKPTPTPIYTAVRLSATATNPDWYESKVPLPQHPRKFHDSQPQWAVDIYQKVQVAVPLSMDGGQDDKDGDETDGYDGEGGDNDAAEERKFRPEVHLHRVRIWGLAASPGGGSTVILITKQSAQKPDHGGIFHRRSQALFGWVPRLRLPNHQASESSPSAGGEAESSTPGPSSAYHHMSTEARMWEWMYGAGPDVPGIITATRTVSSPAAVPNGGDDAAARGRRAIHAYFADTVARQKCDICDAALGDPKEGQTVCEGGHFFDVCGASGIAIQAPGISRACGVCGSRSLKVDELARVLPGRADEIRRGVADDGCGKCGGKVLD